jgi:hypothetical protein
MKTIELRQQADELFSKRDPLLRLWQEIAENFYVERADFTVKRYIGEDFASNLTTSYPLLCRRDFGDAIGSMLRNNSIQWFNMTTQNRQTLDHDSKAWLQYATNVQRNAMYVPEAQFTKIAKQADHDFAAFGQSVTSVRANRNNDAPLYRAHHLRDVVWIEDEEGHISCIFRRWTARCHDLCRQFDGGRGLYSKNSVHANVYRMAKTKPFEEVHCLHMMVPAHMYEDGPDGGKPWRSIYYDLDNNHTMESVAQHNREYIVSRWQTVSGSQYAYSPATVAALPDARLLQAMTRTLLTVGEKIADPPMVATEQAVRSDMDIRPGGVTWVDYEYDERLGAALRPMTVDAKGVPLSQGMQGDCRELISQAFYLNKIRPFLPTEDKEMTAYQAGQIVAQYIRDALPLFEPMEAECNGATCEETFKVLMQGGAFGPIEQIPRMLRERVDIDFTFTSPLHDAIESQKGKKFLEMGQLIANAVNMDQSVLALPDATVALRDALDGIGVPAAWLRSEVTIAQMKAQAEAQQAAAQKLAQLQQGADVVNTLGGAVKQMREAA